MGQTRACRQLKPEITLALFQTGIIYMLFQYLLEQRSIPLSGRGRGFVKKCYFLLCHSGGPNLKLHCQKIYWLSSLQPELSRSVITLPNWLIKVLFPTTGNVFPERILINSSFHFSVIVPLLIRSLESCLASLFLLLILMQHPFLAKNRLWAQDTEVGPTGMSDSLRRV